MGRPTKGKRKRPRNADGTIRKAPSPPADPAVGNDSPPSSDHEGAKISPMHTNDHDDDWRDEDAGGDPGRGQAKLPFGSAVRSAASAAVSAAARTAMAVAPEVAPPARKNAAQPLHRSTQHRHRRARWSKEDGGMAGSLAAWLKPPAQQQEGQHGSPQSMETEGAVEMDVEVGDVGADSSDHDAEKICSPQEHDRTSRGDSSESDTDMLVCSGVGVPLEDWFGEDDQARAAELLYSSGEDSFFDALDSCGPGELEGESGDKADDDVQPQDTGEAEAVGDTGEAAAVGGAGHAASSGTSGEAVRKSSRTNLFDGLYADPARARDGARGRCGGPGRGTRVASGDGAKGRFAGLDKKRLKHTRREERKKTPEQRAREREARERTRERTRERALEAQRRREDTPREKELLDIYRKVVDAIDKAEQSNSYSGIVEDPAEMLTESRLPSIMRTALAIRAYAVLEIEEGVNKMRHSRYVGDVVNDTAQTMRKWVKEFCQDGKFLIRKRLYEKSQADSFIDHEDIAERCREEIDRRLYRRKKKDPRFRVADFQRWVNTVLLKEVFSGGGGISRTTAHSWICRLGFRWKKSGKCVYVDGHNRPDVVEARREYVAKMLILRKMMSIPVQVETVTMVRVRDAPEGGGASTGGGDDDDVVEGWATGSDPLFWPAVRSTADGKEDVKHVLVHGELRAEGGERGCTRVPVDKSDLVMRDGKGDYSLVPDLQVRDLYVAKKKKEEALFWPARRIVDGETEYKHVHVHDGERPCGDCVRIKPNALNVSLRCECRDCKRKPFDSSSRVPFNPRDLLGRDERGDFCLVPDHEVLALYFHGETTAKENDDGSNQWMSVLKGAAIKKKGEGRAAHISDIIGVDRGVAAIGKEAWGMMQEDMNVVEDKENPVEVARPAPKDGEAPTHRVFPGRYERSGIYFGRKEGEGKDGHAVKLVQDAVELLKGIPGACQVKKTKNDPSTAAVIMTVGQHQDGYWNCARMLEQIPGLIAIHELTSEPHRQLVMVFDNSTGHSAFGAGALVGEHVALRPGGAQGALRNFEDDEGNPVHTTFRVGDKLRFTTNVFAPKTEEELEAEKKAAEEAEEKGLPVKKAKKNGKNLGKFKKGDEVKATGPTAALIGLPKGGKQLLMEMGLWEGEPTLRVHECSACKAEKAATRQAITAFNRGGEGRQQVVDNTAQGEEDGGEDGDSGGSGAAGEAGKRRRCCVVRVLSELKAFREELNMVEKLFKAHGHLCIFLPKYHPELNAIERYWGYIKHLLRLHCEYSLRHMLQILPGALSGVPARFIRAWSRVTWLYIEAYDEGLVDYLEYRDLKEWGKHREATARGDAVIQARGAGKTAEQKKAAEAKALAAAQEMRKKSMAATREAFNTWMSKRASRKEQLRLWILRNTMNFLRKWLGGHAQA